MVRARACGVGMCVAVLSATAVSCGADQPGHTDSHLVALDIRTGRPQYSAALPFPVVGGLAVGEARGRQAWVSGSGRRGSNGHNGDVCDGRDGTVRAVDMATGRPSPITPRSPTFGNGGNIDAAPWADAAGIRVTQNGGAGTYTPASFSAAELNTGRTLWRHDGGVGQYSGIAADATAAYVLKLGGPMVALDLHTGRTLWRSSAYSKALAQREHVRFPYAAIVGVASGNVVVIDRYAVVGIDARTGALRWSWSDGSTPYIVQTYKNRVYVAQYGVSCQWDD